MCVCVCVCVCACVYLCMCVLQSHNKTKNKVCLTNFRILFNIPRCLQFTHYKYFYNSTLGNQDLGTRR